MAWRNPFWNGGISRVAALRLRSATLRANGKSSCLILQWLVRAERRPQAESKHERRAPSTSELGKPYATHRHLSHWIYREQS